MLQVCFSADYLQHPPNQFRVSFAASITLQQPDKKVAHGKIRSRRFLVRRDFHFSLG
jgi:hypothetical protein